MNIQAMHNRWSMLLTIHAMNAHCDFYCHALDGFGCAGDVDLGSMMAAIVWFVSNEHCHCSFLHQHLHCQFHVTRPPPTTTVHFWPWLARSIYTGYLMPHYFHHCTPMWNPHHNMLNYLYWNPIEFSSLNFEHEFFLFFISQSASNIVHKELSPAMNFSMAFSVKQTESKNILIYAFWN